MLDVNLISRIAIGLCLFIEYFVLLKILNCLEKRRYKNIYLDIAFLLIAILDFIVLFTQETKYYGFTINLKWISFLLFMKLNYKMSNCKVLIYYLTYTTVQDVSWEFLFCIIYFFVTGHSKYASITSEYNYDVIFLLVSLIKIIINISYIYLIKRFKFIDNQKVRILIIIGCVISNFTIAIMNSLPMWTYMFRKNYSYNYLNVFNTNLTPKLSFTSSFLLLMLGYKIFIDIKQKNEEILLKEKIDMRYKYYLNLQNSQNKVKKLYHDINNHLICIKNLSSEKEDVNKYVDEMSKELNQFKQINNTGNMILDIILNEKQNICNENNICLTCDINFSKCDFIEMTDVCSIFSNILDNAIEACNKIYMDKKYIKIRGTIVKSYYVIHCENSKVNKLEIKNSKIITNKKDKFIHGIGLKSVKSSLKKYNGDLEIKDFENKFLIQIYIPINENMTVVPT